MSGDHRPDSKGTSPIRAVVLGSPWAGTSTLFSIVDVLSSVGRDWEMIHGSQQRRRAFDARIVTLDGASYRDPNGRVVTPDLAVTDVEVPDLVIVPDLHLDPAEPLPAAFAAQADWLRAVHREGALTTSVCSGALLLASAGLLDDVDATTHWAFADMLATQFPGVRLRRERILVPAGEGHRVVTAGGVSAWADLLLYLITRLVGPEDARRIAKVYLLEPHSEGQLCYASLAAGRQTEDRIVADAQAWIARHYDEPQTVQRLLETTGVPARTFSRRFRKATGQTPAAYIQTVRVEEAKQMLETTDLPIVEIAAEVGYEEPSSLRSAFRKLVGISASEYRRKWRRGIPPGKAARQLV